MVLSKIKPLLLRKNQQTINQTDLKKALKHIDDQWPVLTRQHNQDEGTLVGLPYPYIVPAADKMGEFKFEEQYYWDSYFTVIGLTDPKHQTMAEGMLENLIFLFRRFGVIPNASRMYHTSRSQPPLLTSFIFHIYDTYQKDKTWLEPRIAVAIEEYEKVWLNRTHPQWHQVHRGLSRYYDINMLHDLAEAESGWDMTPRFERKCLDFLPIDLNALLYKYEMDFARACEILGDEKSAKKWRKAAEERSIAINEIMWGKLRGFYFDYNYQRKTLGDIWSLAGFYPMWAGMVSPEQAKRLVDNLDKFLKKGGLSTTARPLIDTTLIFGSLKVQWAYPNGWAPLQYIVVEGLRRYGFEAEAKQVATAWVKANLDWFNRHGVFLEKYNVVNPKRHPVEGLYPSQTGFGWTNGVFTRFVEDFNLLDN